MSHIRVQFCTTTWSFAQDEQGVQTEVPCVLENDKPSLQGSHFIKAFDSIRFPHSIERV